MSPRIVFAGGGTAGHAEPALATADAVRAAHPDWEIDFLGTVQGIESRLVPERGYRLHEIPRVPLPRRPGLDLLRLPGRLFAAVHRADQVVREASCVIGFGGYVSTPAYLAARRRGVPIIVHEQNARAGIANRLGARWAAAIATTFAASGLPHAQVIGLPLRPAIAEMAARCSAAPAKTRSDARATLGLPQDGPVLLVTGGSQGSARINQAVEAALPVLLADGWIVVHSLGERHPMPAERDRYLPLPYIRQMDAALAAADLMIGRAGAGTCAEAAALSVPSIFVPLPIGNGEQALNARDSVAAGGAILIADSECDGDRLVREVREAAQRLDQMRAALSGTVHLTAAATLAAMIESVVVDVQEGA